MKFRSLALAGAAVVLTALPAGFVTSVAAPRAPVQCMTDDGYGRFRPCSALYKREHPNWRQGSECMTDDGYGRYRPCSSHYWWPAAGPLPGQPPQQGNKQKGY